MSRPDLARARDSVRKAQQTLAAVYRLDLPIDAARHLLSREEARRHFEDGDEACLPPSGVLACEAGGELFLGLYLDARGARDPDAIVEETSHFVCLAWHALQGRTVSALVLELQSEVDRYLLARLRGSDGLAHFRGFVWGDWMDAADRRRYERAHAAGGRYCRALQARYPCRADLPGLFAELRRFYRAPGPTKLGCAAAGGPA